jgi:hypothetical protein
MIKVHVTKKDINKAEKLRKTIGEENFNYYSCCPVAMALKRTQKKRVEVSPPNEATIGVHSYAPSSNKDEIEFAKIISRFDSGGRVKPTSFRIERIYL